MPQPPEYLTVATLLKPFGVQGEIKARPETDQPARLKRLKAASALLRSGARLPLTVTGVSLMKDGSARFKFAEYAAPETVVALNGAALQVPYAEAERPKGQVLFADVLGLTAVDDATGARYGTVSEVYRASQDLLAVTTPDGREVLVPWVPAFVAGVDREARVVRLTPIPGLFDA